MRLRLAVKPLVPNFFTLTNLFLGFLSLTYTLGEKYTLAAVAILISVFLDRMDGGLARRWGVSSEFGKELDSLADLVSFGIAPAFLAYASVLDQSMGWWGLILAIVFASCGAIRLARFNILTFTGCYLGVPITIAGGLMAIFILMSGHLSCWLLAVFMLLLSGLMVSRIKVPKY